MKAMLRATRLPFVVVMALLLMGASWAMGQGQENGRKPNCYIVSAGIDAYPKSPKLKGDVADARNTAAAFMGQKGKLFNNVEDNTLVEAQATKAGILGKIASLAKVGEKGDFVVIFLSGHGDSNKTTKMWYLLPWDFDPRNEANTIITDKHLLDAADLNVRAGKKVFIIIDACFCGQLNLNAKAYMDKYTDPTGGGLVVIASSNHLQMSNALGPYSAYAKAFYDGMAGHADMNRDGKITLGEIKQYTPARTIEVLREKGNMARQDAVLTWSSSISPNMLMGFSDPSKLPKIVIPVAYELNANSPKDTVRTESYAKIFPYKMQKDKTYLIEMKSTEIDSYLRLENPGGTEVAFDDDGGGFLDAKIVYKATESGEFKIVATTYKGGETGKFTLAIKDISPPPALALKLVDGKGSYTGRIAATDSRFNPLTGMIGNAGRLHRSLSIRLEQGKTYQIDMVSDLNNGGFDSYLFLLGPDGKILARDDDGGGFPNARIVHRIAQTGEYRIIATSFGAGNATGEFTVTITESNDK